MPVKTRLPKRPRALSARREAAARILERLAALYPDAACSLNFANPFELLVATVLSAQTTDARVNAVTPELFSRFPTPAAMATADPRELFFDQTALECVDFFLLRAEDDVVYVTVIKGIVVTIKHLAPV